MSTNKRKINDNYFNNSHFKKTRSRVERITSDEKETEDVKNIDRNIHFY